MSREAQILRIEKISPNDGRGLRTVVFFKGCPLRCQWCSTPESQKANPELYYQSTKCISCKKCIHSCPEQAISKDEVTNNILIDRNKCNNCFICTSICPSSALGTYGKTMTVDEVMKIVQKDEIFYYHSGGGVTLSGGDVLCWPEFARDLLISCKESGIHTMAELDMYLDYSRVAMILPYLDEFYVDIKLIDSDLHEQYTGVDNKIILENTRRAAQVCKANALHIRVPLIWNINDSAIHILEIANYCESLATCQSLEFLPYHRLGQSTYECIGQEYSLRDLPLMTFEDAYEKISFLKELNLPFPVKISGKIIF